jgi:hypothetical protein
MTEPGAVNDGGTNAVAQQYREQPQEQPERPRVKHRSGYARLKSRLNYFIGVHERLQADHDQLQAEHAELARAFDELLQIHNGLLNDLRRTRPQQPVRFGQMMGYGYGR